MYENYYHGFCNKPKIHQCNATIQNNCNCQNNCFIEYKSIYTNWATIPYPGEHTLPIPETRNAGDWPVHFLSRNDNCQFIGPCGEILDLNIKNPHENISIQQEFNKLVQIKKNLNDHEIKIANYWGDGPPSKQFMPIADILIDTYDVPPCLAQRILCILNCALNDTFIVTWHLKYQWNIIRPCQYNRNFKTVLCTPKHPSYPAAHSSTAACMFEILSYFFPQEKEKLYMLATQCSESRVYAGVHYQVDCDEGFKLGASIGQSIVEYVKNQVDIKCIIIEKPTQEYKNANLIPYDLNQYIPFKRPLKCSPNTLINTNLRCNMNIPSNINIDCYDNTSININDDCCNVVTPINASTPIYVSTDWCD